MMDGQVGTVQEQWRERKGEGQGGKRKGEEVCRNKRK